MKNTKLSELPIIPEEYETERFREIQDPELLLQMTLNERLFVNGLIRYYKPSNILEIGVYKGRGTLNILNAIMDYEARLISIDKLKKITERGGVTAVIGELAVERYKDLTHEKWKLYSGVDPSEVMEEINMKFDFVIIDSGHFHPIEVLNFLSVLPWLNEGAIVILHDIILSFNRGDTGKYAPRLLFSSVCAEKFESAAYEFVDVSNIAAFQVTQDTKKYIRNVFDTLLFPWEAHSKDYGDISVCAREIIKKYYSPELLSSFEKAIKVNDLHSNKLFSVHMALGGWNPLYLKTKIDEAGVNNIVFYGGGTRMRSILDALSQVDFSLEFPIWDINAQTIKEISGHAVELPDFAIPVKPGRIMVITIEDKIIANQVRTQFEPLGYTVFHGISALVDSVRGDYAGA
jgi:predicted O-methyltransferase YrrM